MPNRPAIVDGPLGQSSTAGPARRDVGRVKYLDSEQGFGIIGRRGGDDIFFRFSAVVSSDKLLEVGSEVEFDVVPSQEATDEMVEAAIAGPSHEAEFRRLLAAAPPESRVLAKSLLEQDAADADWGQQIGPALTAADVARLLQISPSAVSQTELLRVPRRDGQVVYPIFQFAGRTTVVGVAEVLRILSPAVTTSLTIASFLTGHNRALGDDRPIDRLKNGDVGSVLQLAQAFAERAAV